MATAWQPQEAGVVQLCQLLSEGQQPGANQALIHQQLEQYKQYPDYFNYLSFIFSRGDSLPIELRQSAGLLLKNNLKRQFAQLSTDSKQYIKGVLLHVLPHPAKALRQTAGTVLSVVVAEDGLGRWPDLVVALAQCLASADVNAVDGALDALYKVVEDNPRQLDEPVASASNQPASALLVPPLLGLMKSGRDDTRRGATAALNLMAPHMPSGIAAHMDAYVQGLFTLVYDASAAVRKEVCTGLVQLVSLQPDKLQPHLYQIIEYMLASNEHADAGVATESCEFWMAFCEAEVDPGALKPYLPRLIPVLMKNMVFEEHDEEVADAEEAEAAGPAAQREERDQDLKPVVAHGRAHDATGDTAAGSSGHAAGGDDEDGGGDDDDDDDEEVRQWNLRKCSAASMDMLSNVYGDDLLPVLLPIVEQRLAEADWRARESALLALGAVAAGCSTGLAPFLEGMVAMMLPKMEDARPMVRIISCWCLSRYSQGLVDGWRRGGPGSPPAQLFGAAVASLLSRMADANKFVQTAACSGLATVVETAGGEGAERALDPFLPQIAATAGAALQRYTRRSARQVYDVLVTLAEAIGSRLGEPSLVQQFLPPLLERIARCGPADREVISPMECLTNLLGRLGPSFEPHAKPCFQHCMAMIGSQLEARAAAAAAAAPQAVVAPSSAAALPLVPYDPDFVVAALDVLAGMCEGLGPRMGELVAGTPLVPALLSFCADADAGIRQAAFALVGDLAKASAGQLQPVLADVVRLALRQLEPPALVQPNMAVCNNACWALGELAVKVPAEAVRPYAVPVAEHLAHILSGAIARTPRSIQENSAITLGRLAWVDAQDLAPHWAAFAAPLCGGLRMLRDGVEKEHGFLGLCRLVRANPAPAADAFPSVCAAAGSWKHLACDGLHNELSQLLQLLKQQLAASGRWAAAWQALDPPLRDKLQKWYQLTEA